MDQYQYHEMQCFMVGLDSRDPCCDKSDFAVMSCSYDFLSQSADMMKRDKDNKLLNEQISQLQSRMGRVSGMSQF